MEADTLSRYKKSRSIAGKAVQSLCYAPHTNLFFAQNGDVCACCRNHKYTLGDAQLLVRG